MTEHTPALVFDMNAQLPDDPPKWRIVGMTEKECDYVRKAVNNHDRLVEAAATLMNCHTGAKWQTRPIRDKAFRGLAIALKAVSDT